MGHILVLPDDLRAKLNTACADAAAHDQWLAIGIDTVDDMINRIVDDLNTAYPGMSITSIREENKNTVKLQIGSSGNVSMFVGYFENDRGFVDALFFYILPDASNANDFFPAKIMPPLFGIYNNIKDRTKDLHIHYRPVFIINLCTTSRVNNASVKKQMICCEALNFNYYDIFQNEYHDVIGRTDADGNAITKLYSFGELDQLLGEDKQLGPFFIEFDLSASAGEHKKQIKNKLLHYLWSDVHRASYKSEVHLFKEDIGTFKKLYECFEHDTQIFSSAFINTL